MKVKQALEMAKRMPSSESLCQLKSHSTNRRYVPKKVVSLAEKSFSRFYAQTEGNWDFPVIGYRCNRDVADPLLFQVIYASTTTNKSWTQR